MKPFLYMLLSYLLCRYIFTDTLIISLRKCHNVHCQILVKGLNFNTSKDLREIWRSHSEMILQALSLTVKQWELAVTTILLPCLSIYCYVAMLSVVMLPCCLLPCCHVVLLPCTYLLTGESVLIIAIGVLMFLRSQTFTVLSSDPLTTLSLEVKAADVTEL